MKKSKKAPKLMLWVVSLFSTLALVACGKEPNEEPMNSQITNPAAEYCISSWWEYEIVDEEFGQVWVCNFSEYWICEEWDFFNTGICGEYVDENNSNFSQKDVEDVEESEYDILDEKEDLSDVDESHWVSIVNSASEFCEQLWWIVSIVESEWWEKWMCNFSDWTSCEEWALFNRECWLNKIPAEMIWAE